MSSNQQATGNYYRELISEVLLRKGIATKEGWRRRRTKPETSPTTQQPTTVEETDK